MWDVKAFDLSQFAAVHKCITFFISLWYGDVDTANAIIRDVQGSMYESYFMVLLN